LTILAKCNFSKHGGAPWKWRDWTETRGSYFNCKF